MVIVKWPLVTGFCGGLVIFVACAYLGGYGTEIVTYRWRKPMLFESLRKQNDGQLRADLLTLQTLGFSKFNEDTPSALQKDADYLGTIRSSKRPELRPVFDLQIASDYVEMARLEQEAANAAMADHHRQMAEGILHSLGWQDVSSETLAKLTHGQLWWKRTK
jgi:hypothetical protein